MARVPSVLAEGCAGRLKILVRLLNEPIGCATHKFGSFDVIGWREV